MRKKTIKIFVILILTCILLGGSVGAYIWFKPHRDVQAEKAFAELKVQELVNEFTTDAAKANAKYLASNGNSKVLIVEGPVSNISTNQNGEKVIILKAAGVKSGVSATFTKQTSPGTENVKIGDYIKVKGAITSGNSYDDDLDLYSYATLIQCEIVI